MRDCQATILLKNIQRVSLGRASAQEARRGRLSSTGAGPQNLENVAFPGTRPRRFFAKLYAWGLYARLKTLS